MSASMYGNPYTYKPPPPKIKYPSLFSGFNNLTLKYLLDSKILALAVILIGAATLIDLIATLLPFWFQLVLDPLDGTFGSMTIMRHVTINTGLFYMRETQFDNTVFLSKYTNAGTVPSVLQAAQVFSIGGTCILVACLGGSAILVLRRFASVTALIIMAGAMTLASVFKVLVILTCAVLVSESSCDPYGGNCRYKDNLEWHMVPMYSYLYRVEPTLTPYVKPNWGYYVAILGVLLVIAAAVMVWIEAFMNYKNLRQIRYQQLKEYRDPYEKEADAYAGGKYLYRPPVQPGPNSFGMQPVMATPGYEGMVFPPPTGQAYIPPPSFEPPRRAPSPSIGFDRRYVNAPSVSSTGSGHVVTEIDL